MDIEYRHIQIGDTEQVISFCDKWIGKNYFTNKDIEKVIKLSIKDNLNASILALDDHKIIGIRLSFAPGKWLKEVDFPTMSESWKISPDKVAYFKSLFIDESYRSLGIGPLLSKQSMKILAQMGAKAILCHSWDESPENSSRRYLDKYGFQEVTKHKNFWANNNYECVECAPGPCQCTATEMIYYIDKKDIK